MFRILIYGITTPGVLPLRASLLPQKEPQFPAKFLDLLACQYIKTHSPDHCPKEPHEPTVFDTALSHPWESFRKISQPPLLTTIHPAKNRAPRNILLMVQKSGVHQLRLVAYPIIYRVLYIPGGVGFLPSTVCSSYSADVPHFRPGDVFFFFNQIPNHHAQGVEIISFPGCSPCKWLNKCPKP